MLIVVLIIVVFVVLALANTGNTAGCRWREDRTVDVEGLSYWRCHVCGATEKSPKGRVPNVCRADRNVRM
jgi:hypothetical protein